MSTLNEKMVAAIERLDLNRATFNGQSFTPTYVNFLFGKNGTGKTTIAGALRAGMGLTWSNIVDHQPIPVRVFDREFIARNIAQLDGLGGVFTLGEDNIDAVEEIKTLLSQKQAAQLNAVECGSKVAKARDELTALRSKFEERCWQATQDLRNAMPEAFAGMRKSKRAIADYVLQQTNPVNHDSEELKHQYRLAHDATATPFQQLTPVVINPPDDTILATPITSKVESEYSRFLARLDASDWVRHGHSLYAAEAGDQCPYCQQQLPPDFEQTLKACFDSGYEQQLSVLQSFAQAYRRAVSVLDQVPAAAQLAPMNGVELGLYDTLVGALKDRVAGNLALIDKKVNAPSITVSLEPLDERVTLLNEEIARLNAVITAHNDAVANQAQTRKDCTAKAAELAAFLLKQQVDDYNTEKATLETNKQDALAAKESAENEVRDYEQQIHALEQSVANTTTVMNQINDHLRRSGFQGFHLRTHRDQPNTYQVVRADGSLAQGLSEGEQNFIAFLYFYFLIQGSTTPNNTSQKIVVVIDDPVSSMDTDALHIVASLVRGLIDECTRLADPQYHQTSDGFIEQIFILTHNPYFMDAVSRQRIKNYRFVSLFKVTKKENQSTVETCIRHRPKQPSHLENYSPVTNSYAALWEEYREVTNPQALLGVCQRILDHYFLHISGHEAASLNEEILVNNRHRFVGASNDDEEDVTRLNHAAALLAQLDTRRSPVGFDDVYATGEINEDQCRQAFRTIFEAMGQAQHYNMMAPQEEAR